MIAMIAYLSIVAFVMTCVYTGIMLLALIYVRSPDSWYRFAVAVSLMSLFFVDMLYPYRTYLVLGYAGAWGWLGAKMLLVGAYGAKIVYRAKYHRIEVLDDLVNYNHGS